jgi:hypothetical protein
VSWYISKNVSPLLSALPSRAIMNSLVGSLSAFPKRPTILPTLAGGTRKSMSRYKPRT